jgi:hypothetical protein
MAGIGPVAADGLHEQGSTHGMSTWTVETVTELEQAFAAIADGGRIELAPGSYGQATLSDRAFVTGVTITSAVADDPAVFTDRLVLDGVRGVSIDTLQVEAAALAPGRNYARLLIDDSTDVTVSDVTITGHIASAGEGQDPFSGRTKRLDPIAGYGQDIGLRVKDSADVTLTGLDLSDLRMAIGVGDVQDITIRDVEIHAVREGINVHDVRGVLIEDSVFRNFTPWTTGSKGNNDHPDMIQYYGANSSFGVHDLTIRNNLFQQDAGDRQTQTIYGSRSGNPNPEVTLTDFSITGNTIINGHLHGISVNDVQGGEIRDNVLLPKPDLDDNPRQVHTPGIVAMRSGDLEIAGNTLLALSNRRDMKIDHSTGPVTREDNIFMATNPDKPLFWRDVLAQVEAGTWAHGGADHAMPDTARDNDGPGTDGPDDDGPGTQEPGPAIVGDDDDDAADHGVNDTGPDDVRADEAGLEDIGTQDKAAIVAAAYAAGWTLKTGDPAGDRLDASEDRTVLIGGGARDWVRGRDHDSIMLGGAGGDKFVFNFRDPDADARHTVVDLDWATGDFLQILTPEGGHRARSAARLEALVADGPLAATAMPDGAGLRLHVADRPGQQIDLIGIPAGDLLDWV